MLRFFDRNIKCFCTAGLDFKFQIRRVRRRKFFGNSLRDRIRRYRSVRAGLVVGGFGSGEPNFVTAVRNPFERFVPAGYINSRP
jgi:hypothetical protein